MKYPAWAVQVVLRVEAALRDVQQHLRIEHEFYCNGIVVTNYNQNDKRDDNCSWQFECKYAVRMSMDWNDTTSPFWANSSFSVRPVDKSLMGELWNCLEVTKLQKLMTRIVSSFQAVTLSPIHGTQHNSAKWQGKEMPATTTLLILIYIC